MGAHCYYFVIELVRVLKQPHFGTSIPLTLLDLNQFGPWSLVPRNRLNQALIHF
jgi:hypothetical protein